jgi:tRNA(adenine34) deaminase
MIQARIARCVFGAVDPKVGASSLLGMAKVRLGINHRFPLEGGCLDEEAAELLRAFFRSRRAGPGPGQSLS